MSITIAEYLLTRLAELGVRYMFGVPGDFNLWFLEQTTQNSDITFVGCCHELNAAYAANGCSRLADVSALATTYGVGELASLAGVTGAYAERVPIVCRTGVPRACTFCAVLFHGCCARVTFCAAPFRALSIAAHEAAGLDRKKSAQQEGRPCHSNQYSQQPVLTADQQLLNDAWQEQLRAEFTAHSADEAIATIVDNPRLNQVPVMIGGNGEQELHEFYARYFLSQIPPDTEMVPVSRTIGQGRLVGPGVAKVEILAK
jgi:Thiamine pyrophosphate enzyme, N-terminal TPP binding domain